MELKAKAVVELDGHSLEIICQELKKGVERARSQKNDFRAKFMEKLIEELQREKQAFHAAWENKILSREKQKRPRDLF